MGAAAQFDPDAFMQQRKKAAPPAAPAPFDPDAFMQSRNQTAPAAPAVTKESQAPAVDKFIKENEGNQITGTIREMGMLPFKVLGIPESESPVTDLAKSASLSWLRHPIDAAENVMDAIGAPIEEQHRKAEESAKSGDYIDAGIRSVVGSVPIIGDPIIRGLETFRQARGESNVPEMVRGAGEAGAPVAQLALPGTKAGRAMMKGALRGAGELKSAVGSAATKIGETAFPSWHPEPAKALTQALQPTVGIPKFGESAPMAGEELQRMKIANKSEFDKVQAKVDAGQILTPAEQDFHEMWDGRAGEIKNFKDVLDHAKLSRAQILQEIEQRLGPTRGVSVAADSVADAMENSISSRTRLKYPGVAKAIEDFADSYRRPMTITEVESAIEDANNELRNAYKRNPKDTGTITPDLQAAFEEVAALRKLQDGAVQALTGESVRPLKRLYGAMRDIERAAAKQELVAARAKPMPLYEAISLMTAAGQMLRPSSATVGGFLKNTIVAGAKYAYGKTIQRARDSGVLLDKAFQGPRQFGARTVPPPPNIPAGAWGIPGGGPTPGRAPVGVAAIPAPPPPTEYGGWAQVINPPALPPAPPPEIPTGAPAALALPEGRQPIGLLPPAEPIITPSPKRAGALPPAGSTEAGNIPSYEPPKAGVLVATRGSRVPPPSAELGAIAHDQVTGDLLTWDGVRWRQSTPSNRTIVSNLQQRVQQGIESGNQTAPSGNVVEAKPAPVAVSPAPAKAAPEMSVPPEAQLKKMVSDAGGQYLGIQEAIGTQPEQVLFHDPQSGSTLQIPTTGATADAIADRIAASRAEYEAAQQKAPAAPPAEAVTSLGGKEAAPASSPESARLAPPAAPVQALKSVGQTQDVIGLKNAVVKDTQRIDGVDYELYQSADGKEGVVRAFDSDSGEVVSMKKYPDFAKAEQDYREAVSVLGEEGAPAVPESQAAVKAVSGGASMVPVDAISTDPKRFQPREGLAPGRVEAIRESIRERGYDPKEPVTIWRDPKNGKDYVLAGHHRFEAATEAGQREIPAHFFQGDEKAAMAYARRSNSTMAKLSPIEEGRAFQREIDEGKTPEQIGPLYGGVKSAYVEDRLALNNLAPQLQQYVQQGVLKTPLATALGKASGKYGLSEQIQLQIFDNVIKRYEITPKELSDLIDTAAPKAQQGVQTGLFGNLERGFVDAFMEMKKAQKALVGSRRALEGAVKSIDRRVKAGEAIPGNLARAKNAFAEEVRRLEAAINESAKKMGESMLPKSLKAEGINIEPQKLESPGERLARETAEMNKGNEEQAGKIQGEQMGNVMKTPGGMFDIGELPMDESPLFGGPRQQDIFSPPKPPKKDLTRGKREPYKP